MKYPIASDHPAADTQSLRILRACLNKIPGRDLTQPALFPTEDPIFKASANLPGVTKDQARKT